MREHTTFFTQAVIERGSQFIASRAYKMIETLLYASKLDHECKAVTIRVALEMKDHQSLEILHRLESYKVISMRKRGKYQWVKVTEHGHQVADYLRLRQAGVDLY